VTPPLVGVLALQGDVREHAAALQACDARVRAVRRPADLEGLDGLVLPGGESTTIEKLSRISGIRDHLVAAIADGLPTYGSCAGLILLADHVVDRPGEQQMLLIGGGLAHRR
jgi:5'-phosphate synthase pdxT subunit